jgi:hypothetical protein
MLLSQPASDPESVRRHRQMALAFSALPLHQGCGRNFTRYGLRARAPLLRRTSTDSVGG